MKRRRNSTSNRRSDKILEKGKDSHLQIDYSGPSFSDLPNNILVSLLLSLPIKSIFVCKSVCKAWYDLISDPDFAMLHFKQARVCHLLRTSNFSSLSRILYLVRPDDFDMSYDRSPIKIKLDCKLKLSLCNIEKILGQEGVDYKNRMKFNMRHYTYDIVNSCNGLLCLSSSFYHIPVAVCNSVTGEFMNLPVNGNLKRYCYGSGSGFGFTPASNQYKVIRMFSGSIRDGDEAVQVHVLGTKTWRVLPFLPKRSLRFPTYLNGCVYWFSCIPPHSVISFDIEKESFESISVPTPLDTFALRERLSMGVLGGALFISSSNHNAVRVWTMKDNGANKTWSQIFSFSFWNDDDKWPKGSYQPINYVNSGALLMFHSNKNGLICKDPRKTGLRYLKVQGFRSKVEVIAHTPSFVPLKQALSGHNVKVLDIKSRCAKLKLEGEEQVFSIVEQNRKITCDSKDVDQDYDSESEKET